MTPTTEDIIGGRYTKKIIYKNSFRVYTTKKALTKREKRWDFG